MNKQIHIEAGQVVREAARVQPSQLPLKSLALAVAVAFQPAWAQVVPATPVQVPVKLPATPVAKNALPTGGQVVAGSATIKQQGQELTVQQTTQKLITNWQSFNIGAGSTVNFVQPSAHAVALNRVLGTDVSVIQGALNANGQVWLHKRPARGIWAGLFSLPVFDDEASLLAACTQAGTPEYIAPWKHVLTHRDLHLHPVRLRMRQDPLGEGQWVDAQDWPQLGLPAPIRLLLDGQKG